ncbi:MAG: hypothetical protein V7L11_28550 [Nostoc sp.]|uniref:hypothetical protein n=1 Tax=Nostoc sp. TaxID=1180 RepID=UPI002FF7561C
MGTGGDWGLGIGDWGLIGGRAIGSVKARDAMNRRPYNNQFLVETAIHRVFVI